MCYSYMHTPAMHIMPRYAMRHVHSGCTRAAALLARARGRHHELARLSQGWAAEEWAALDSCGNSVAHVAALRGAARFLRLAYGTGLVAASTRNAAGWTALQEAHPTHCGCRTRASLSPSCVAVLIPTPTPALIPPDPSPAGGHRFRGRAHGTAHLRPDGPGTLAPTRTRAPTRTPTRTPTPTRSRSRTLNRFKPSCATTCASSATPPSTTRR